MADKLAGKKSNAIRDQMEAVKILDQNDPVYDSECEGDDCFYSIVNVGADSFRYGLNKSASYSKDRSEAEYGERVTKDDNRNKMSEIVQRFLKEGGKINLGEELDKLNCPSSLDVFVVEAVRQTCASADPKHEQMAHALGSLQDKQILTPNRIARGFEKLVQSADDLKYDIPEFVPIFTKIMLMVIEQKVIEPKFLDRLPMQFLEQACRADSSLEPIYCRLQKFKADIKKQNADLIKSREITEITKFLESTDGDGLLHELIISLVRESLDHADRDKETVAHVLDLLYGKVFNADDMQIAFSRLLAAAEDLQLDTPNIITILAKFLSRCVVDELLPPAFILDQYRLHTGGETGMTILRKTQKWLTSSSGKCRALQFQKVFTGTDPSSLDATMFKHELKDAIDELYDSLDSIEFRRLLHEMHLTFHQHVEVVRKVIVAHFEKNNKLLALDVLSQMYKENEIDSEVVTDALQQVHSLRKDIKLDNPAYDNLLKEFQAKLVTSGLLGADFEFRE